MKKDLLQLKRPTEGQLIYMRGIYSKEQLVEYMVNKWSHKFNRCLTDRERSQFRKEVDLLGLSLMTVLASLEDEYLI